MEGRFEFEERMHSDRRIEQAIVALKKGANLLKCGQRGKPKLCPFWLSSDEKMLIWYSDKKEKHLNLSSISNTILGQKTVNFQRERWPEKEPQSLSLIYDNGECSIDLICKDKEQAESWFIGLTSLTSNSRNPKHFTDFRNNQQNISCIYSPATFIRRKNKSATIQDPVIVPTIQPPVRFSKVRSLYGSPRVQSRYFSDNAFDSSSEIFFSPRLRHGLEIESFLEKFVPHLPPLLPNKNSVQADLAKDWKMSLVKSTEESSLDLHKDDNLKDIFMWGNSPGNIFDNKHGKKADSSLPKLLDSVQSLQIQKIICGESHAALVTKQGEVFSWGEEKSGRLGHKTNINISHPKTVESLSNFRINTLALGAKHTCVLTTSGQLYTWGESESINTENIKGKNATTWFPHLILDDICVSKVSCGDWHTCIISSSGNLYTFGDGTFGVLGHGDTKSISKPKQIESLKGLRVKSVSCGPYHTAAVVEIIINNFKSNNPGGKLFTWGDNDGGKLGHKDKEKKLVPTCVAGLVDQDFVQVSCGNVLTVGLTVSGVVFTMGSKIHGQLGNPTAQDGCITCVDGLLKTEYVKEISCGSFHVAVLTSSGKIFMWGRGLEGQLGLGNFLSKSSPNLVEALGDRKAESVSCGSDFTAAVCLHRNISSKDHTICNGCKTVFGFTKKKHNCYNCGCTCCNSCSGNKVLKAALAPDRSKRYRVCDQCFSQFEDSLETRMDRVDKIWSEVRTYTPKVSRILKEGGFIEEKIRSTNGVDKKKLEPSFLGGKTRWGQVDPPKCFSEGSIFLSGKKMRHSSDSDKMAKDVILSKDVSFVDSILSQEIKRLRHEVAILIEQCQQKCSRIQQNRRKIDETRSFAKDEASNCKALNDVVNLLINQRDVLSDKLSSKQEVLTSKESFCQATCTDHEISKDHKDTKLPNSDEITEEIERGIYVTFFVSPSGKKSLKRVRFSRKHFNEGEAKQWWTDNGSRALQRYDADPLRLS